MRAAQAVADGEARDERERRATREHEAPPALARLRARTLALALERRSARGHDLAGECAQHVRRMLKTVGRFAFQTAQDRLFPRRIQIGDVRARVLWRFAQALQGDDEGRVAVEGERARDHLVEHDAERVDVGGGGDGLAFQLFGRDVGGRADDVARIGERGQAAVV